MSLLGAPGLDLKCDRGEATKTQIPEQGVAYTSGRFMLRWWTFSLSLFKKLPSNVHTSSSLLVSVRNSILTF